MFYLDLAPLLVRDCNVLIFFRCPHTQAIEEAITLAHNLGKKVLYDIDDLAFDTKYTDFLPYVHTLSQNEKAAFDVNVLGMGKVLRMCDGAITTTSSLAQELKNYARTVYINRNCASEHMISLSSEVLFNCRMSPPRGHEGTVDRHSLPENPNFPVTICYFSGSITHNADFELVKPALLQLLEKHAHVRLLLMGQPDVFDDLKLFREQVIQIPFPNWEALPQIIASVDINLAPISDSIFNNAKSENKWIEAALVQVVTVASRRGAFKEMIEDGVTGFLCEDDEWYPVLLDLINDTAKRTTVAKSAYHYCKKHCCTISGSTSLKRVIDQVAPKRIAFVLPSLSISGGIMVAFRHACFLQDTGWNVDIIVPTADRDFIEIFNHTFNVIGYTSNTVLTAYYDAMVATMWCTLSTVMSYERVKHRYYLVQNYETDFYAPPEHWRIEAESTYHANGVSYITISKWCQQWLEQDYGQQVSYAPNGIQLADFPHHERDFNRDKIRILIEGDCSAQHKNVDESFAVVDRLPSEQYEIWYMSYNAEPKPNYRVDRFLHCIPYNQVGQVYAQCDILLKSSWLESFSYPPLEMMATGGYCVVAQNEGNVEYLSDGENCLFYELGNIEQAVKAIERICADRELRNRLYANGLKTAHKRDWNAVEQQILALYHSTNS